MKENLFFNALSIAAEPYDFWFLYFVSNTAIFFIEVIYILNSKTEQMFISHTREILVIVNCYWESLNKKVKGKACRINYLEKILMRNRDFLFGLIFKQKA